ncbi:MAG: NAD-dependent epimerase/dehydratase family protein, partial [Nitrososphaeria archaeon]|nr:NAD-dependent epimerase/dehydratase family protein [Nitrososphaeria archaeon]
DNNKIPIYGTGKNVRDWIYVLDHCDAILKVCQHGKKGNSYNIAGHNEIDNITIVRSILEIMGKSANLIKYVKDRPGHDFRYSLKTTKIKKEIGWKPKYTFEDGLRITVNWYLNNSSWWQSIAKKSMGRTK